MKKEPEESNEGFYLDEKGRKCDAAFFDDDDDDVVYSLDVQIDMVTQLREEGEYSEEYIKKHYPLGWAALQK